MSGSTFTPSKRTDSAIALDRYAITSSFRAAAFRSVSSVMYVALIHSAVDERIQSRFSSALTVSTNASRRRRWASPAAT